MGPGVANRAPYAVSGALRIHLVRLRTVHHGRAGDLAGAPQHLMVQPPQASV